MFVDRLCYKNKEVRMDYAEAMLGMFLVGFAAMIFTYAI
jgi:hypothetical protein